MHYILQPGDQLYNFSYQELKDLYDDYSTISDEAFKQELTSITHFACFVSYLKELNVEQTLSDIGIIHQLVHLMHIPDEPLISLSDIRQQFNELLKLS